MNLMGFAVILEMSYQLCVAVCLLRWLLRFFLFLFNNLRLFLRFGLLFFFLHFLHSFGSPFVHLIFTFCFIFFLFSFFFCFKFFFSFFCCFLFPQYLLVHRRELELLGCRQEFFLVNAFMFESKSLNSESFQICVHIPGLELLLASRTFSSVVVARFALVVIKAVETEKSVAEITLLGLDGNGHTNHALKGFGDFCIANDFATFDFQFGFFEVFCQFFILGFVDFCL